MKRPDLAERLPADVTLRCGCGLHEACTGCACSCHDPQPELPGVSRVSDRVPDTVTLPACKVCGRPTRDKIRQVHYACREDRGAA